jgi:hypothetical protein
MMVGVYSYSVILLVTLISDLAVLKAAVYLNRERFSSASGPEEHTAGYVEAMWDCGSAECVEYIVSYLQNPGHGCPPGNLKLFLVLMARRTDDFGSAARAKIEELGIEA